MQIGTAVRLAGRELRGGVRGFRVFLACLVLGTGAIAAIGSLRAAIEAGLRADARLLLGGDVSARLTLRPADAAEREFLARSGTLSETASLRAMARSLDSNEGVYFVPALTGLGAPSWEPEARGTIVGLTRGTTREHLVRAALEAMAYGTADVLEAMRGASGAPLDVLRVDGGATFNDWLMQFQADVLGVPVERPDVIETTAMGAAYLAGLTAGLYPDFDGFAAAWQRERRFEPRMDAATRARKWQGWRDAVSRTLTRR